MALAAVLAVTSCSGSGGSSTAGVPFSDARHHTGSGLISHVVIIVQENRSFNNLFATFPGADGTTRGKLSNGKTIRLKKTPLVENCDFGHSYKGFVRDYDGGKMDGFDQEGGSGNCPGPAGRKPYQYVDPTQIAPYWDMASEYVLADHMFQTQGSGSFSAHQDLIRGGTTYDSGMKDSLVDYPNGYPWGCDAPASTKTSFLQWTGTVLRDRYLQGPFPCTNEFPGSGSSYRTLRDLLDAKPLPWKYYTPKLVGGGSGGYWNAFDVIWPVRYGPEWTNNVISPDTKIFDDIAGNTLPAVSWLIPDAGNSDHPGKGSKNTGPSWVASVVNAIGDSTYWDTTAIIVTWDDWGGFYDGAKPLTVDHWGGLGFRVPMIVISPYAREATAGTPGYVSHTHYEFGSIIRFVEDNWNLGRLGTTDVRAASMNDCFDFSQTARPFQEIPSAYRRDFFLRQAPSNRPVDTE